MTKPKTTSGAHKALQQRLALELRRLARRRDTTLAWYHTVGSILKELAPKSSKRSVETYAAEIFKNENFVTTLYACRKFADTIPSRQLPSLDGLSWAIVHHLIYGDDKQRPTIVATLQRERRRKVRVGERLTPLEARMIVQEICGKAPIRRAKQSKVPTLGPKSALRETVRMSEDWIRYCGTWLQVVARHSRTLDRDLEGGGRRLRRNTGRCVSTRAGYRNIGQSEVMSVSERQLVCQIIQQRVA